MTCAPCVTCACAVRACRAIIVSEALEAQALGTTPACAAAGPTSTPPVQALAVPSHLVGGAGGERALVCLGGLRAGGQHTHNLGHTLCPQAGHVHAMCHPVARLTGGGTALWDGVCIPPWHAVCPAMWCDAAHVCVCACVCAAGGLVIGGTSRFFAASQGTSQSGAPPAKLLHSPHSVSHQALAQMVDGRDACAGSARPRRLSQRLTPADQAAAAAALQREDEQLRGEEGELAALGSSRPSVTARLAPSRSALNLTRLSHLNLGARQVGSGAARAPSPPIAPQPGDSTDEVVVLAFSQSGQLGCALPTLACGVGGGGGVCNNGVDRVTNPRLSRQSMSMSITPPPLIMDEVRMGSCLHLQWRGSSSSGRGGPWGVQSRSTRHHQAHPHKPGMGGLCFGQTAEPHTPPTTHAP